MTDRCSAPVRVELVRESEPMEPISFRGAADIYVLLREEAALWDRERFAALICAVLSGGLRRARPTTWRQ